MADLDHSFSDAMLLIAAPSKNLDLDAIEEAAAGWDGRFAALPAMGDSDPRLAYLPDDGYPDDPDEWSDLSSVDPHCHESLAVMLNAAGPLVEEVRRLRRDLAAARAEADALRGLVGEACDGWEDQTAMPTDGPASVRARAEKAGGK